MKIAIKTYGCTLNKADSDMMEALLAKEGHQIIPSEDEADVVIINSCTVKGATENKIMHHLRELKEKGKKVVVAGCLTTHREQLKEYTLVSPGSVKNIADAVGETLKGRKRVYVSIDRKDNLPRIQRGVIAHIAIQDGCLSKCTFCETKVARPKLVSQSIASIKFWISQAISRGAREIQLAGMDTGTYGLDIGTNLPELLENVESIPGIFMARIGMNNPQHIKRMGESLISAYRGSKIYKFLHTAVQSGSERVVQDMRRTHTVKDFEEVVKAFRENFPAFTVATDIIVGYPTEEESDFEDTLRLIRRVEPEVVNLSRFTPRPLTEAAKLKQLPSQVVKERSRIATEVIEETTKKRNKSFVGKELLVLVTERGKGRSKFYRQVVLDEEIPLGSWCKAKIRDANHTSLFGEITEVFPEEEAPKMLLKESIL